MLMNILNITLHNIIKPTKILQPFFATARIMRKDIVLKKIREMKSMFLFKGSNNYTTLFLYKKKKSQLLSQTVKLIFS